MNYLKYAAALISIIFLVCVWIVVPLDSDNSGPDKSVKPMDLKSIDIVKVPYISSPRNSTKYVEAQLEKGSNLNDMLIEQGISRDDASSVVYEISPYVDLRSIQAGEVFELKYVNNVFCGLTMVKSEKKVVEVDRDLQAENGFRAVEKDRNLKTYVKEVSGKIENSLYDAAMKAGMDANVLYDFIRLLSYDIDFQRDIQPGDTFHVAFEAIYDDKGKMVDSGHILYGQLLTGGRNVSLYYYTDLKGQSDYFNGEGETIRKTLLRTPINGAVISSGYGMRISPISGFTSMHKGIDFAAPRGTPIYASGDGVVILAYYSKVYGNFIQLRHKNGYKTLYAHMNHYASGIHPGVSVKQGQVIGYVGTTGESTGPHLHYEVAYWDKKINPASVKSPPGRVLKGNDLVLFENLKKSYIASFK